MERYGSLWNAMETSDSVIKTLTSRGAILEGLFRAFHRVKDRGYMLSIGFAKCNALKCKSPSIGVLRLV